MASIRERKDANGKSKWHAQVRINGYPPQTQTFTSKKVAKDWADETELLIKTGRFSTINQAQKKTVKELFEVFRLDYMLESRRKDYTQILGWWESRLGEYYLIDLKAPLIQKQVSELQKTPVGLNKPRSRQTVVRYIAVLSRVMSVAVDNLEWLDKSPIRGVKKPDKEHEKIPRVLGFDEEKLLLVAAKSSDNLFIHDIILIALRTGMRYSEIMTLRWKDIDWLDEYALITLQKTKNKRQRVVPLVKDAFINLLDRRNNINDESAEGLLLFPSDKNVKKPVEIRKAWVTCLRRAKVTNLRFHDLRHTAASRFATLGYSLSEIAEILGHTDQRSTQIYTHFAKGHTVKMAKDAADFALI